MIRLLLHSSDTTLQLMLKSALGAEFQFSVEGKSDKVREIALAGRCDVIILDLTGGDAGDQLELFEQIRSASVQVVVMMDDESRDTAMDLLQRGVHNYFRKPPSLTELKIAVTRAFEYGSLRQDLEKISGRLEQGPPGCDQLLGSSARLRHVYDLIDRVAKLDASILITGESGTGKELIARAVHNRSDRKLAPFVAVSCGAIPETLIEAELFGYEKGAFTGATGSRRGFLEQAGRGTVLLDEIGELSQRAQVGLLRVVQERQFCRLGSSAVVALNARLLFATHRNLPLMVEAGDFRLDLYYRINVMGIEAPALRDHTEDIPVLARHFLSKFATLYHKSVAIIAPGAMALLVDYLWPGNVRELENVIQKAIILTDDDTIRPEHLPDDLQRPDLLGVGDSLPASSFEDQLRGHRIQIALKAVQECHGNKTLAARSLHISRTYLHRLTREPMEENLDPEEEDEHKGIRAVS